MSFAENLKEMLDSKDIEIKELSHGTGISKNTIDNYLSGQKSIPNAENAVKIAKYLGTTVEFLVEGSDSNYKKQNNEFAQLIFNLNHLKKEDFEAINKIVKSLSGV